MSKGEDARCPGPARPGTVCGPHTRQLPLPPLLRPAVPKRHTLGGSLRGRRPAPTLWARSPRARCEQGWFLLRPRGSLCPRSPARGGVSDSCSIAGVGGGLAPVCLRLFSPGPPLQHDPILIAVSTTAPFPSEVTSRGPRWTWTLRGRAPTPQRGPDAAPALVRMAATEGLAEEAAGEAPRGRAAGGAEPGQRLRRARSPVVAPCSGRAAPGTQVPSLPPRWDHSVPRAATLGDMGLFH